MCNAERSNGKPAWRVLPVQLSIDHIGQIGVHLYRRQILRKPLLQRLAAEARANEHTPAPGVEGRLEIVDLVADEGRLGGDRPIASQGLA